MKIIFAQGNPGPEYKNTRHNIGFLAVDTVRELYSGGDWKKHSKASAEVSEVVIEGEKALLVKPLSFYNETGLVARSLIDFYKLTPAEDFLVIHDDLALPFGTVRTREQGSAAGNNGIKSLNQHLGNDYARIRIGIWNDLRDRINDADFVLSRFTKAEQETLLSTIIPSAIELVRKFTHKSLQNTSIRHE